MKPSPTPQVPPGATGSLSPQWFQILLALADQVRHGSGIVAEVLERTQGEMRLWPGTLYGSLSKMASAGLVEETAGPLETPEPGGKRRYYRITALGSRRLAADVQRLDSYVRAARAKQLAVGRSLEDDLEAT